ncbi:MAG: sugar phosphate isomerase/epimerase family protein, partial [bacterium]
MPQISGIADEAGDAIETQIAAHQALGWQTIELRMIDGRNIAGDLPELTFEHVVEQLAVAGLRVTGFASAIGNWSRHIDEPFECDVEDLKTAARRMHRLNVRYIRTMSWRGEGVDKAHWRDEAIRRYRELARIAEGEGVVLAHENCTGWGGLGPE